MNETNGINKTTAMILSSIILIGTFWIIYRNLPTDRQLVGVEQNWESKIDEQAAVVVTVTPVNLSSQSKEWQFNVSMETHSVNLDQDLTKLAVLIDDRGKEYAPLKWDGPLGGHHVNGNLTFNGLTSISKSIELKISGIAGVVRTFAWQL